MLHIPIHTTSTNSISYVRIHYKVYKCIELYVQAIGCCLFTIQWRINIVGLLV